MILYIWPTLPKWIAQIGPTYYFLQPIFEVSVSGAGLADVWFELVVAAAICIALVPVVAVMGARMERDLADGTPARATAPA